MYQRSKFTSRRTFSCVIIQLFRVPELWMVCRETLVTFNSQQTEQQKCIVTITGTSARNETYFRCSPLRQLYVYSTPYLTPALLLLYTTTELNQVHTYTHPSALDHNGLCHRQYVCGLAQTSLQYIAVLANQQTTTPIVRLNRARLFVTKKLINLFSG